jgi:hypothetical protein
MENRNTYCSPARTFPVPWTGDAGWHIFGNQPAVCCGVCGVFRSCDSITGQSLSDYKKQGWHRVCVTGARGLASRENGANVFAPSWTYFGSCSEPSFRDADADAECHSATHHLAAVTLYGFSLVAPRFFSGLSLVAWFSGCSGILFVTAGQVSELTVVAVAGARTPRCPGRDRSFSFKTR